MPTVTYRTTRWGAVDDMVLHLRRMWREGERNEAVAEMTRRALMQAAPAESHAQTVLEFVRSNFPYQLDPAGGELFTHPRIMAADWLRGIARPGDCDDMAMLTGAMMGALGYKTRLLLLDTDMDGQLDHAVSEWWSERLGEWVMIDATTKYPVGWVHSTRSVRVID